jgi:predicted Zn finger-like uncharacterized protein
MIIVCINCNKKFNVNSELIPSAGRQIQCGSCNHTWHYIVKDVPEKTLISDNTERSLEIKGDIKLGTSDIENLFENRQSKPLEQETNIKNDDKEIKNTSISIFFSYLLVLIISLFSLLILIDTLKTPLINIFPKLEIILFSLFETLKDVKLFIIDLT